VTLRLVAAGELIDVDPQAALAHAEEARRLASAVPAVREAAGLAAYYAGEWATAIAQLRAYHRMSGRQSHLAVLADCERALGRPERAIDIFRAADREKLTEEEATELLIVASGARGDLGQHDAAAAMLQVPQLSSTEPWAARLRYAYADALLALGRTGEAREWFARAAEIDEDSATDAAERLLEIDGVVLDDVPDETDDASEDGSVSDTDLATQPGDKRPDGEADMAYDDDDLADDFEDEDVEDSDDLDVEDEDDDDDEEDDDEDEEDDDEDDDFDDDEDEEDDEDEDDEEDDEEPWQVHG
jgi:tetratricopeptide (TPR) repeat protein